MWKEILIPGETHKSHPCNCFSVLSIQRKQRAQPAHQSDQAKLPSYSLRSSDHPLHIPLRLTTWAAAEPHTANSPQWAAKPAEGMVWFLPGIKKTRTSVKHAAVLGRAARETHEEGAGIWHDAGAQAEVLLPRSSEPGLWVRSKSKRCTWTWLKGSLRSEHCKFLLK